MANKEIFEDAAGLDTEQLSRDSILEAAIKVERLKDFYEDPYHDGYERWYMAEYCLDYLCNNKAEGTKRKDGVTENILHEINQLILQKSMIEAGKYEDGIHILPRKVTYKVIDGNKIDIPIEEQSMERLVCATSIHDIDEDFPESSVDEFKSYITDRIVSEGNLSDEQRNTLLLALEADCKSMVTLTFGRKTFDNSGNEIELETFEGDRNLYMDAVELSWATIGTKVTDKLDSLTSRYGEVDNFFSISSDMSHIDESNRLFRIRQTLENMAEQYPEMEEYFNLMDAKLNVASKCLECMTLYHPSKLALSPDKQVNPKTAKIDISNILPQAVKHSEYLDKDTWMLQRMMDGFEHEAARHPELANIVAQMKSQYDDAIELHFKTVRDNGFELYDKLRGNGKIGDDIKPDIT